MWRELCSGRDCRLQNRGMKLGEVFELLWGQQVSVLRGNKSTFPGICEIAKWDVSHRRSQLPISPGVSIQVSPSVGHNIASFIQMSIIYFKQLEGIASDVSVYHLMLYHSLCRPVQQSLPSNFSRLDRSVSSK